MSDVSYKLQFEFDTTDLGPVGQIVGFEVPRNLQDGMISRNQHKVGTGRDLRNRENVTLELNIREVLARLFFCPQRHSIAQHLLSCMRLSSTTVHLSAAKRVMRLKLHTAEMRILIVWDFLVLHMVPELLLIIY